MVGKKQGGKKTEKITNTKLKLFVTKTSVQSSQSEKVLLTFSFIPEDTKYYKGVFLGSKIIKNSSYNRFVNKRSAIFVLNCNFRNR